MFGRCFYPQSACGLTPGRAGPGAAGSGAAGGGWRSPAEARRRIMASGAEVGDVPAGLTVLLDLLKTREMLPEILKDMTEYLPWGDSKGK